MQFPALIFTVAAAFASALAAENPTLVALVQKGDDLDRRQQTRSALASFEEADRLEPNRLDVMLRISKEYSDLARDAKSAPDAESFARAALEYALRALHAGPDNAKANLAVAVSYGRLTDYVSNRTRVEYSKLVHEYALKSVKLDPTDDFAHHVLGRWNYGIANVGPFLKTLAKIVYGGLPKASNEDAVRCFREAIRIAPERIIHRSELARTYEAMGQKELARAEWQTLLKLSPRDSGDEDEQRAAREALGSDFRPSEVAATRDAQTRYR